MSFKSHIKFNLKEYLSLHPILYNILLYIWIGLIGTIFLLIVFLLKNRSIIDACDGAFGSFAILFGYGSLKLLVNLGTFDSVSYGFANMTYSWKKGAPIKYKDLYTYKEMRIEKRKKKRKEFIRWYIVSALFLIIAIVLFISYKNIYA